MKIENEAMLSDDVCRMITEIGGHAQKHEDQFSIGIPDISYGIQGVNGWIELKIIKNKIREKDGIIDLPLFTTQQRKWMHDRGSTGGFCFLLVYLAAADQAMAFDHSCAFSVGVDWTVDHWIENNKLRWDQYRNHAMLKRLLTGRNQ